MTRYLFVLLANLLTFTCTLLELRAGEEAAASKLAPTSLRCEYLVDPLGIDARHPRLSWMLESSERAQVQSAYQVLVASDLEGLSKDRGDLWDSGKVPSASTTHIAYGGRPLASRMLCFWKIRAWDGGGKASAWSKPARWSMGLLEPTDWKAEWIGCEIPPDDAPDKPYLPAPHLRKEFSLASAPRRATIYATAAGVYELYLNGKRIGQDCFAPGWTEYSKRLYYQTYDVTGLLWDGKNVLGAILGDGWYGLHHGGRGTLRLRAQLEVELDDGKVETFATDASWKATHRGPVLHSDMYNGESYDARREMPGWSESGFDQSAWKAVICGLESKGTWTDVTDKVRAAVKEGGLSILASNAAFGDPIFGTAKALRVEYKLGDAKQTKTVPEGQTLEIKPAAGQKIVILKAEYGADARAAGIEKAVLQAYPGVPVRKTEEVKPVEVKEPKPGAFVFNLAQNFSGWVRLKARGDAGAKVTLRFAEMLQPDGNIYTTNLRGAKCTDTYILKGSGGEVWEPRFTFHGFQYVEVTGYPGRPGLDAITGVVVNSSAPFTSEFECSNPMLRKLFKNIVWGQRSNYLEVPTDCPQRDERLGWTGDAQAFIGTGAYNMDVAAFFTSWLITLNDTQRADGGYTDVAPRGGGVSAGWSDAGVICPWTIWRMYGDARVIEDHFDGMARWIAHCEKNSKGLLRPAEGYGDWLNVSAEMPKDVIATAYFGYSTKLLAEMARAVGRTQKALELDHLFERIKDAFNAAYVGADGRIKGDTQTTYLMALGFGLLPKEKEPAAVKYLLERIEERKRHLSTGFLGVNLLLPTLTKIGRLDLAYQLLQNETYPSWGYPVKHGATTIWERWDGWTAEKGFQDPGMNSFNHYAYGSCGQWMFSTMAGIDTDGPGFRRVLIRPRPGGGIQYTKASYDSICGKIATAWEDGGDALTVTVTIPANTTATVYIPAKAPESVTEGGKQASEAPGVKFLRMEGGPGKDSAAVFAIGSGTYRFVSAGWPRTSSEAKKANERRF